MTVTPALAELRRLLDDLSWGDETPVLRLLAFETTVRTTDAALARELGALYGAMRVPESETGGAGAAAPHVLSLSETVDGEASVHVDGALVLRTRSPAVAFSQLVWELNRQAIEHTTDRVLVHAAAAARGEDAVVLVGPMGSGKSTLVAALLRDGFDYVTDEVVAIDPASSRVDPYPKPISLGGPGDPVPDELAPLAGARPAGLDRYLGERWLVAPERVRTGATAARTRIRAVVAPEYAPGAPARLEPVAPAEAVVLLAEHTFHLERHPQVALDALARVVEEARCFRLVSGDPDTGAGAVAAALRQGAAG